MFLVIRHFIGTEQNSEVRFYVSTQEEFDYTWTHIDHGCNTLTVMCYCDTEEKAKEIVHALDFVEYQVFE